MKNIIENIVKHLSLCILFTILFSSINCAASTSVPKIIKVKQDKIKITLNELLKKCRNIQDPNNNIGEIKNLKIISRIKSPDNSINVINTVLYYMKPDMILYFVLGGYQGLMPIEDINTLLLNDSQSYFFAGKNNLALPYGEIKNRGYSELNKYIDYLNKLNNNKNALKLSEQFFMVGKYKCYKIWYRQDNNKISWINNVYIDSRSFLPRLMETENQQPVLNQKFINFDFKFTDYKGLKLISENRRAIITKFKDEPNANIINRIYFNDFIFNSDEINKTIFELNTALKLLKLQIQSR